MTLDRKIAPVLTSRQLPAAVLTVERLGLKTLGLPSSSTGEHGRDSRNRCNSNYDQSRLGGVSVFVHRLNTNTTTTITSSNPPPPAGMYQSLPPCMLHASMATGIIAFILCFSFSVCRVVRSGARSGAYRVGILTANARAHQGKSRTLFALCIRGGRGDGAGLRGLLRRGGLAVRGIRGAAGYQGKGNDGKTGDDYFFHA